MTQRRIHGGGQGGRSPPLDWGQKKFIARPKNTHLQTPFCMPECAETHLQQSRISKFSGGGPQDPPLQGEGREGEGRRGRGKGREGGGRIGKGGEGREGTGEGRREEGGGEGREGHSTWASPPPPRDKLWIPPEMTAPVSASAQCCGAPYADAQYWGRYGRCIVKGKGYP